MAVTEYVKQKHLRSEWERLRADVDELLDAPDHYFSQCDREDRDRVRWGTPRPLGLPQDRIQQLRILRTVGPSTTPGIEWYAPDFDGQHNNTTTTITVNDPNQTADWHHHHPRQPG